ncbi:DUF2802 domain-containing protein [Chitinivorax sp. PXF-14]|uniref:DUF2802 domain-containing protein n=1 Tax=Chitinivorax sp. PXF-14 TaxID=3230488 RepID=UPI0034670F94
MNAIVVTWRELLVAGAIVLGIYVAEWLMFLRTSKRNRDKAGVAPAAQASDELEQRIASLESELSQLKRAFVALASQPPRAEETPSSPVSVVTPYAQAVELARQGMDAATLSSQCGISRGEAELIIALYRFDSA